MVDIAEIVKSIDKATEILTEALDLNEITDIAASSAAMRIYVSVMIVNEITYEDFCEGLDRLKKDYKRHCDALEIE